jgi:hypothetical protein
MDSSAHNEDDALRLEGRVIVRRFTDQLTGTSTLEQQVQDAQLESDEEEEDEQRQRLRMLYEGPANSQAS